jgi:hypothetical protein
VRSAALTLSSSFCFINNARRAPACLTLESIALQVFMDDCCPSPQKSGLLR